METNLIIMDADQITFIQDI